MTEKLEPTGDNQPSLNDFENLRRAGYLAMLVTGLPWVVRPELATDVLWGTGVVVGAGAIIVANVLRQHSEEN